MLLLVHVISVYFLVWLNNVGLKYICSMLLLQYASRNAMLVLWFILEVLYFSTDANYGNINTVLNYYVMRFQLLWLQATHISVIKPVHLYNCPQKNKVEPTKTLIQISVDIGIKIYSAIRLNDRVDTRISIRETNLVQNTRQLFNDTIKFLQTSTRINIK